MALVQQNLGSDVFRSAAQGVGSVLNDLCEAKVGQLHVAIVIDEDVLRLEIAVNDVVVMAILEDRCYLRSVEHRRVVVEAACFPEVRKELAADNVLQQLV